MNVELTSLLSALGLGAGISFLGSVPMTGPLAVLVLDRIIAAERRAALWIALGGALVEGGIAAGVASALPRLLGHSASIVSLARLSGALIIFAVGLTLALRPKLLESVHTDRKRQGLLAGFLTTALNPTLIATWTVTVTALHANGLLDSAAGWGLAFGAGAAAGGVAWSALLLVLGRHFGIERLTRYRPVFGRGIGIVLGVLGAGLFVRVVWFEG